MNFTRPDNTRRPRFDRGLRVWAWTLLALIILWSPCAVRAQIKDQPSIVPWEVGGPTTFVRTIKCTDTTTYLGGRFVYAGPHTGNAAPMNVSTGQVGNVWSQVNGKVNVCIPDGSGGWYVGGSFTQVGRFARNNLVHILADGSVDSVWDPSPSSYVLSLAKSGNLLYVGGQFQTIGGQNRARIAAVDAISTGAATAWNPGANNRVAALIVSGGTVYAGGYFTKIGGGQTRNRLAALEASSGNATTWDPNVGGLGDDTVVYAMVLRGDTLYIGGNIYTVGTDERHWLAAVSTSTGAATSWYPTFSNTIYTLALSGNTLYVGGYFYRVNGTERNSVAAVDATTGALLPWNPDTTDGRVSALAVAGDKVLIGGQFSELGGTTHWDFGVVDATTGTLLASSAQAGGEVLAIGVSGNSAYVGGLFTSIGGINRNNIVALDNATGAATNWNPNVDADVYAIATTDSTVYIGGGYTQVGGVTRHNLAAVGAATGAVVSAWNPDADFHGEVYDLALHNGKLYTAGRFVSFNGGAVTRNRLAAIDPVTGAIADWNPNIGGEVLTIAPSGNLLYVGGKFTSVGSDTRNRIAAIDLSTGAATAWAPSLGDIVNDVLVANDVVYAVGEFFPAIAAFNANDGTPLSTFDPPLAQHLRVLTRYKSSLLAGGGQVASSGGVSTVSPVTGDFTGWACTTSRPVQAVAVTGDAVHVGGEFTTISDQSRTCYARFDIRRASATDWQRY
jgi:trimeric autotransporter adhesin